MKLEKINQKVDRLEEFCKSNPVLWISGYDFLDTIADKDERKGLEDKLEQALADYSYISVREGKGKLSNEYIERLREAGIGQKFGYKKEIEDIASQYTYDDVKKLKTFLYYACAQYGNLDNFKQHYIQALINGGDGKYNVGSVLNRYIKRTDDLDKYFITTFDISSPNFQNQENDAYILIWERRKERWRETEVILNKAKLKERVEELPDQYYSVLNLLYGIESGNTLMQKEVAKAYGCSQENIRQFEKTALKYLGSDFHIKEKDKKEAFIRKFFEYCDIFASTKSIELDEVAKKELQDILDIRELDGDLEKKEDIKLKDLSLSAKTYNGLIRNGLRDVDSIVNLEKIEFNAIIGLGRETADELISKVHSLGLKMRWEKDIGEGLTEEEKRKLTILELRLSTKAHNCLTSYGRETNVECLINLEKEDFYAIWGLGKGFLNEIIERIHSLGLKMKWEREEEKETETETAKKEAMDVRALGLTTRTYKSLLRNGKNDVGSLVNLNKEEFYAISSLGKGSANALINRIHSLGLKMKWEREEEEKETETETGKKENINIRTLDLATRTYNSLLRNGKNDVGSLVNLNKEEFYAINGLGKRSADELINRIHLLGLKMKWERDEEEEKLGVDEELENTIQQLETAYSDLKARDTELEKLESQAEIIADTQNDRTDSEAENKGNGDVKPQGDGPFHDEL